MKDKKNSRIKKYIISSVFILALSFFAVPIFCGNFFVAYADVAQNATGWLWGGSEDANMGGTAGVGDGNETGVYSISVNDVDENGVSVAGSAFPYGVNIPLMDGLLSGYAWSETLGWISFNAGDVAGCPSGVCNARREENLIKGWARILSIKKEYEKVPSNSGGWTGFIMLDGVTITPTDGVLHGFGWNGETPGIAPNVANGLGWIDFSRVKIKVEKDLSICGTCGNASGSILASFSITAYGERNLEACFGEKKTCEDPAADNAIWTKVSPYIELSRRDANTEKVKANNTTTSSQSATITITYTDPSNGKAYGPKEVIANIGVETSEPEPDPIPNSEGWKEVAP